MHTWKQLIAHGQHAIHMQPCSITTIHETLWSAQCGSGRKPRLGVIADASRLGPPYTTNESLNKSLARANNIGPKQCWIVLRVLIRQLCRVRLLRAGSESSALDADKVAPRPSLAHCRHPIAGPTQTLTNPIPHHATRRNRPASIHLITYKQTMPYQSTRIPFVYAAHAKPRAPPPHPIPMCPCTHGPPRP